MHTHKSERSCPYSETQGAFTAPWASCFPEVLLIGWPSLLLSEWGSGSKSSLCVMRSLSEGNTIRVERGRKGGLGEARRGKVYIAKGRGGEQQGAGQGRNKNRPLTLSAVTHTAASSRGECSLDSLQRTKILFLVYSQSFVQLLFNRLRQFQVLQLWFVFLTSY